MQVNVVLVSNNVRVIPVGYEDPALEGEVITFTCPSGLILTGSNSSICVENEEWESDPREQAQVYDDNWLHDLVYATRILCLFL